MVESIRQEAEALGIVYPSDEAYIAMHEAWTGIPKINVCVEDLDKLPRIVFEAALRHEAAHSTLHGSPEYYAITLPSRLIEEFKRRTFRNHEILNLAYIEASALKDFETTSLLLRLNFIEDQIAFILYNLKIEDEEKALWKIVSKDPKLSTIYIVHLLKAIAPTLTIQNEKIVDAKRKALNHLTPKAREAVKILEGALRHAEGSFQEKVVQILKETLKMYDLFKISPIED
jgi:hypothetical protein